jgi:hypothetical protein
MVLGCYVTPHAAGWRATEATTLYSFCAEGNFPDCTDGEFPNGALLLKSNTRFTVNP